MSSSSCINCLFLVDNGNENKGKGETDTSDSKKEENGVDMENWNGLFVPEPISKALSQLGFSSPTRIQRSTLPAAIKGKMDVVGAAETGSGKTLAFGIPMLDGIIRQMEKESEIDDNPVSDQEESEDELEEIDQPETAEEEDSCSESDFSDPEAESGCVKVINNVQFDFDNEDEFDFIAPPLEVLNEVSLTTSKTKYWNKPLYALVLTPTRELAIQVKNHIQNAAKFTNIKV